VDGGTLSNFPIAVFDKPSGVPLMPTIGCQLGLPRDSPQNSDGILGLLMAMFNTSTHIGDNEFINNNPIYDPLVAVSAWDRVLVALSYARSLGSVAQSINNQPWRNACMTLFR
jgi:predicted acylesterase/phospholipase RssA